MIEYSFVHDENFQSLVNHYRTQQIVLYLGAGASWSRDDKYGLGGWNGLIERIFKEYGKISESVTRKRYKNRRKLPAEYLILTPDKYWSDLFQCRWRLVERKWKNDIYCRNKINGLKNA